MKKIFILVIAVATLLLGETTKRTVLPPYEPYSGVSKAVMDFFDNPDNRGKKLHVEIAYTDILEEPSDEIIFEHRPNVGEKKIWINGLEVSESYYGEYLKNLSKKRYRAPGFDSLMSFEEIQPDVTNYTYWNGNNDCCFSGDGSIELTETGIQAGHRYKIAIAWLVPGSYILQNGYLPQDIDIDVYQGNTLVAYSISGTNPFEMVDFTTQSSQDLRIVIKRFSNSGYGKVALGYAMWHN